MGIAGIAVIARDRRNRKTRNLPRITRNNADHEWESGVNPGDESCKPFRILDGIYGGGMPTSSSKVDESW